MSTPTSESQSTPFPDGEPMTTANRSPDVLVNKNGAVGIDFEHGDARTEAQIERADRLHDERRDRQWEGGEL